MYTLGRKAVERHVLTCAATSMHGIKLTREKMIGKHFSRHGPKGLTKLPLQFQTRKGSRRRRPPVPRSRGRRLHELDLALGAAARGRVLGEAGARLSVGCAARKEVSK